MLTTEKYLRRLDITRIFGELGGPACEAGPGADAGQVVAAELEVEREFADEREGPGCPPR
ncbi:hypothetical protein [Saccharothrix australiensis]|uniref:hypothetical protein n=1 Tax=Saccharothrix australiensis TaxID=2072 RepID=UPI001476CDA1|nr:hypothetical protein [Saccharothrix australiensis]